MDTAIRPEEIETSYAQRVQRARYILDFYENEIKFSDIAILFPLIPEAQCDVEPISNTDAEQIVWGLTEQGSTDNHAKYERLFTAVDSDVREKKSKRRERVKFGAIGAACVALVSLIAVNVGVNDSKATKFIAPKQWTPPPGTERYAEDGTLLQPTLFGGVDSSMKTSESSSAAATDTVASTSIFCLIPTGENGQQAIGLKGGEDQISAPELDPYAYDRQWNLSRESGLSDKDFYRVWDEAGKLYEQNGGIYDWKTNQRGYYWQRVQVLNEEGRFVMDDNVPTVAMELMPYVQKVIQRDDISLNA